MTKRCCEGCAYAVRLRGGQQELLVCAGRPETPGQLTVVQPSGACRRFLKRRSISARLTPPEPHDGICYIALTKGKFAIVDAADYERVNAYKWCATGSGRRVYACRHYNGKNLSMHRFLMNPPQWMVVDHIDGNGLNNRRSNLRICTQRQNVYNSRPKGKSSRYKGVCRDKSKNRWVVYVRHNGRNHYVGRFRDEIEAARAYDRKAYELFGEFAWLNFPEELRGPGGQASWIPEEPEETVGDIDLQGSERSECSTFTRNSQVDADAGEPDRFSLTPGSLLNLRDPKDSDSTPDGGGKVASLARSDAVRRFFLCPSGHTTNERRLPTPVHHSCAKSGLAQIGGRNPSAGFVDSCFRGNDKVSAVVRPATRSSIRAASMRRVARANSFARGLVVGASCPCTSEPGPVASWQSEAKMASRRKGEAPSPQPASAAAVP